MEMTTFEILQVIIGSGSIISIFGMIFKMGKFSQKIDTMNSSLEDIKKDISDLKKDLRSLDSRISRLEGIFEGWLFHDVTKTGTEKNK